MTNFVKARKCSRCAGTGSVPHARDMGRCYGCDGHGQVETDKATLAAKAAYLEGRKALGTAAFSHSSEAHFGLCQLEENAPERLVKAVVSFVAGDPRVLPALVAYAKGL